MKDFYGKNVELLDEEKLKKHGVPRNRLISAGADFRNPHFQPRAIPGHRGALEVPERQVIPQASYTADPDDAVGRLISGKIQKRHAHSSLDYQPQARTYFGRQVPADEAYRAPTTLSFQDTLTNTKPQNHKRGIDAYSRKNNDLRGTPNLICPDQSDYTGFTNFVKK